MIKVNSTEITTDFLINRLSNIEEVCNNYGLHAEIINFKDTDSVLETGIYVVVGVEPINENINPYRIANRKKRNPNLFFPREFAIRLTTENVVNVFDEVMYFCSDAEFLSRLYAEFKTDLPECIRYSELSGLRSWCEGRYNVNANDKFRTICQKGLKTFFKNEKSPFGQKRRSFFRTERFVIESSWLQRQVDYVKRKSNIVRLEVLLHSSNEIGVKKISAHELKPLLKRLESLCPEILISISKKDVVDNGLIGLSKKLPEGHPYLQRKPVTEEEFDKVIHDRFASEGFECTNDIQPAHWEFYDIYYKKVDEPQIIAAYNDIYFAFANHDPLQTIKARGEVNIVTIPINDFHSFVALAKSKKLQFYIDNYGRISVPSFKDIHVAYSKWDEKIVGEIVDEMVEYNILYSHID